LSFGVIVNTDFRIDPLRWNVNHEQSIVIMKI
jgi:hypothetical protein